MKHNAILRLSLTLLIIAAVMAGALAAVNAVTRPIIAKRQEEKTQAAISAVLPGGGEALAFTDTTGLVTQVYGSDTGYAVQVTPNGFKGSITMMVGVSKAGEVLGIRIIRHTETPSLGDVAAADSAAGEAFRSQFVGMSEGVSLRKDGGEIDALTGATITSKAICEGVNAALACVKEGVK